MVKRCQQVVFLRNNKFTTLHKICETALDLLNYLLAWQVTDFVNKKNIELYEKVDILVFSVHYRFPNKL
jgi:hypothetical protein